MQISKRFETFCHGAVDYLTAYSMIICLITDTSEKLSFMFMILVIT